MGLPVRIFFENLALVAEARSGDFTSKAKKESNSNAMTLSVPSSR